MSPATTSIWVRVRVRVMGMIVNPTTTRVWIMVIVIVIVIVRGRVRVRARTEVRIRANFGVKGRVMVRLGLRVKMSAAKPVLRTETNSCKSTPLRSNRTQPVNSCMEQLVTWGRMRRKLTRFIAKFSAGGWF